MKTDRLGLVTLRQRAELPPTLRRLAASVWPPTMEVIQHDAVCRRHWSALTEHFAEFQPVLCDRRGRVVAGRYTIPFAWNGQRRALPIGVDGVLVRGVDDRQHGRAPTTLSALLAVVDPPRQGLGPSRVVIRGMATLARRHGLRALVAPVRPTLKQRYPLTPMERYVRWRRPDRAPFDPCLRVHWELGARVLGVARRSMVVQGGVAQ